MDRTKEHLGTSDAAVIRARRQLLAAARALQEEGTPPPGVQHPELYTVRSCTSFVASGEDWQETLGDWHYARTTDYPVGPESQGIPRGSR